MATTGNMPMTDSEWLHYRDLKSRCPACKRPAQERAFELAKHDYYGFLDYKEDRYTTVYGYMD